MLQALRRARSSQKRNWSLWNSGHQVRSHGSGVTSLILPPRPHPPHSHCPEGGGNKLNNQNSKKAAAKQERSTEVTSTVHTYAQRKHRGKEPTQDSIRDVRKPSVPWKSAGLPNRLLRGTAQWYMATLSCSSRPPGRAQPRRCRKHSAACSL